MWLSPLLFLAFFSLINPSPVFSASPQQVLTFDYIDKIFKLEEGELNLNQHLLEITRLASMDLLGEDMDTAEYDQQFQTMAQVLSERFKTAADDQTRIRLINEYLFNDQKFEVDRSTLFESTTDELLLNRVMTTKKGHCLSLSLVYLCLGERLGLSLNGVMFPNHFFVRFSHADGAINIETTAKGEPFDNEHYRSLYLRGFDDQISAQRLGKKETIAVYLANLANQYKLKGTHEFAMRLLQAVIELMPDRAGLYINLGNTYERDGQIITALGCYQKALGMNPYLCEAHYNIGLAHFLYTKRYDDARRHGLIAVRLGCRVHPEFRKFLEK
ncbi:MAG TPA: transglutaminase family protein [Candidatus Bathyarchaeia archaeon]|nr:transglutaminase family protein [Candidatus Bathyarchaeia archaeon]